MGYNTRFAGSIRLSRQLTLAEARWLLEMNEDRQLALSRLGVGACLQWVPSTDLQHIVFDGGENFYEYPRLLRALCKWLDGVGIEANGTFRWSGEEVGDTGVLKVVDNVVTVHETKHAPSVDPTPLTMDELVQMALDRAAR